MENEEQIAVEVAYAHPEAQVVIEVTVHPGATVAEAIERSGVCKQFPEIDLSSNKVGRWSHVVALNDTLRSGDRVEIYRALIADPKEVRRQRAAKKAKAG